jgi:hypothetical protein
MGRKNAVNDDRKEGEERGLIGFECGTRRISALRVSDRFVCCLASLVLVPIRIVPMSLYVWWRALRHFASFVQRHEACSTSIFLNPFHPLNPLLLKT